MEVFLLMAIYFSFLKGYRYLFCVKLAKKDIIIITLIYSKLVNKLWQYS